MTLGEAADARDAPAADGRGRTAPAPAKINLTLSVGPARADGFHDLRSVFLRVGLSDRLGVEVSDGTSDRLTVAADPLDRPRREVPDGRAEAGDLGGANDLVLRAIRALRFAVAPRAAPPLVARLDKRIPVEAGLGGGSSDAATALRLAADAWQLRLGDEELADVGARLGSDVPFFTRRLSAALVTGRGERIAPLPAPAGTLGLLLVMPDARLSTRAVFAAWDELREPTLRSATRTDELAGALERGLPGAELADAWAARIREANDLWPAAIALHPPIAGLRDGLEAELRRPVLLSGSGPALVTLYPSREAAEAAGRALVAAGPDVVGRGRVFACDLVGPDASWRYP